jgi:sugar phosphate isomerase/epimerase
MRLLHEHRKPESVEKLNDIERLCLHTITTNPLSLAEAAKLYAEEGIRHITVWEQHLKGLKPGEARQILEDHGLNVVSLCRGGFFPASGGQAREDNIKENFRLIDMAAELGAPMLVLVCGATPEVELPVARQQIIDGILRTLPHAKSADIKLGIEPLHPMYADTRSAINTLDQANNIVSALGHTHLGVVIDTYHLWWDPYLRSEIRRAQGTIFGFHVSDWRTPTRDLVNDRGVMGEGCINIPEIRAWVTQALFKGPIEVEIFSTEYWEMDQQRFIRKIKNAYLSHV